MVEPIIKIKDVSIVYNIGKENEFHASDHVNMEIYPGEYIIFFGPSGCGKSTILYCVLGVLPPTSGQILVKGENPYAYSAAQMVRYQTKVIGIMYQAFYLIPSLTIMDNVTLPMIFEGVPPNERKVHGQELLNRFGIGQHGHKLPDALSGGQIQRVSVARAFINDPQIILADEPVGNLDSKSADQVMDTLDEINRVDKKTIILVTHDAKYLPYAHRVIYVKDGKVVRIVPNPEKKQIAPVDKQKTLVTEMEQLAKVHPYLSPSELKVKSMINYLTQEFTLEQLNGLEKYSKLMIDGKITREQFYELLTASYENNGLEIKPSVATKMAEKIDKVLTQAKDVGRYRRRLERNNFYGTENNLIVKLLGYVIEEFDLKLDSRLKKRLKEVIYDRISGLHKKEKFIKQLYLPVKDGGLGFEKEEANKITQYFEKLLIQGIETEGKGH